LIFIHPNIDVTIIKLKTSYILTKYNIMSQLALLIRLNFIIGQGFDEQQNEHPGKQNNQRLLSYRSKSNMYNI